MNIFNVVVNKRNVADNPIHLTALFAALADPTRRRILQRLSEDGETRVTLLARPFRISLPAISRHLRVLERARLIQRHRSGRLHLIRARAAGLREAREWIMRCAALWDSQFDALDELLKSDKLLKVEKRKEKKK
jgi:DNA-binding transcriptional ArsR family regulator